MERGDSQHRLQVSVCGMSLRMEAFGDFLFILIFNTGNCQFAASSIHIKIQ